MWKTNAFRDSLASMKQKRDRLRAETNALQVCRCW